MSKRPAPRTADELAAENEELRARLEEAEETLRAIRSGEVDALVVATDQGERLFTLEGAEYSYRVLIEDMNEGAATLSQDGSILYCNRRFAEMLKAPLEKVIGSIFRDWITAESQTVLQNLLQPIEPQIHRRAEATLQASDGTSSSVYLSINDLRIKDSPAWFGVVVTDLTEHKRAQAIINAEKEARENLESSERSRRILLSMLEDQKQAQEALLASEAELRALFSAMLDVVLVIDRDGVYRKIAPTNPGLLYKPPAELLGKKLSDVFPTKKAEEFLKAIHQVLETQQTIHLEYELPIEDRLVWFSTAITPLDAENTVWVAHDITERKRSEAALQRQLKEIMALHQVSVACNHAEDEDELIAQVTEVISREFYPDHCGILLVDEVSAVLKPHFSYHGISFENAQPIPVGTGLCGLSAQDGKVRRVGDVRHTPGYLEVSPETRSELCVPVKSGERVLAVINTESNAADFFSEADERLLITIAGQLATAIERLRSQIAEREQRAMAEAISATAAALNRSLDVEVVLADLLENVHKVIASDTANILMLEGSGLRFTNQRGYKTSDHLERINKLNADFKSIPTLQEMLRTGEPLLINDTAHSPLWVNIPGSEWIRAYLAAPILLDGQVIGFINLDHSQINFFTPAQARALKVFAEQASSAIKNARLYQEARRRLTEMEAVNRVSTALRTRSAVEEMVPIMLDETLRLFGLDTGGVWLFDATTESLAPIITRGWQNDLPHRQLKPGEGIIGHTFQIQETYITLDYHNDPHLYAHNKEFIPAGWGGVCVPLRSAEETLGVFILSAPASRRFSTEDLRLLNTIGEISSNAIRRAALHAQTLKQVQRVSALREIDRTIASTIDMRLSLKTLLIQATSLLKVDAAAILLLNPGMNTLRYAAKMGLTTPLDDWTTVKVNESYAGRAILERCLIEAHPPAADMLQPLQNEHFTCYYGLPLIAKGNVVGVLEVFHRSKIKRDAEWFSFLETLAGQAAVAIDNAQMFERLQASNAELTLAYEATIEGWSRALDLRDHETEGHTQRVADLTLSLARAMGIPNADLVHIRRGALLHDIGKMGIPDSILLKPGALTEQEMEIMRRHPVLAYEMLAPIQHLRPALDIPYRHHEKWDGSGYPHGLRGEQIPLAARIFAVVDVWDALTSDRPYRSAWSKEKAIQYIREQSGAHFDPKVVETFLRIVISENDN